MPIELFWVDGLAGVLIRGVVLTTIAVLWTILLVRIVGLRSFSKMTAFDFVSTVATASLIAQACTRDDWFEFGQALIAIAAIFLAQGLFARALQSKEKAADLIRNQPLLLMRDGRFIDDALRESGVTRQNMLEKIRGSSATRLEDVRAVVLETTGDVHVITEAIDPEIMKGVRGWA